MSRIYTQQKRPGTKAAVPSYDAPSVHTPSLVSGQSSSDLDALMQAKYRQHFLDNQIPTAEAEADRIAASVSGARTPEEVKTQLGEKMGADFSNVTFHTDSAALKQADAMGARAYTSGSDVYFGSGGFDPGVAAHELVHTVQQGMVGSAMQTTSAPTGGVQMKSHFFKGIGRSISHLFPETSHKKKQRQQAHDMIQDIIFLNPNYFKNNAQDIEALEGLYGQIERAYSTTQSMYDSLPPERKARTPHPIDKPMFSPLHPANKESAVSMNQIQQEYESMRNYYQDPVRIDGMNGKSMLKNARALQALHKDFDGLDIRGVRKMSASLEPDQHKGIMDASAVSRELRINDPFYSGGFGAFSAAANLGRKVSSRGITAANHNYTLAHESGHLVNFQLADMLNEGRDTPAHRIYGSSDEGNYNFEAVSRAIIAETMAKQATEGKDKKLAKILRKHGNFDKQTDLNSKDSLRVISDLLKNTEERGESRLETLKSGSPLLRALRKQGYTSVYGASDPAEMYAEAFGEHYKNNLKEEEYTHKKWYKWNKLRKIKKNRNKLSDAIVARSKELFHNAGARSELMEHIGISPEQEALDALDAQAAANIKAREDEENR